MSEQKKITIKEVRESTETSGLKIVTTQDGTIYKFTKAKKEGGDRKGWLEIAAGDWNVYDTEWNGEHYITAAYPVQANGGGGFKGGGKSYGRSPEERTEIIRQNCAGNAVNMVNTFTAGKFDCTLAERVKMTLEVAGQLEAWIKQKPGDK